MKLFLQRMQLKVAFWLTIALLFGINLESYAQKPANYDSLSPKTKTDLLFAGIRKDSLSTGILYDRVFPIAGLTNLNNDRKDTISTERFFQGVAEFVFSSESRITRITQISRIN